MDFTPKKVFRIVSGKKEAGTIKWPVKIGEATQFEGSDYYIVKFNMQPEQRYYLKKNEESQVDYTVFSDVSDDGNRRQFRSPCGFGKLTADLKTFLTIKFPFPGSRVFVDLMPAD